MKVIRPHHTLLFLAAVASVCVCIAFIFPPQGVHLGDFTLRFKSLNEQVDTASVAAVTDIDAHLAKLDCAAAATDTLRSVQRTETIASLQFADGNSSSFFTFFELLQQASNGSKVHVFHYGDSQIEGDRMTNIVRDKLQTRFGGSGCGLICPLPVAPPSSVLLSQSSNWKRYTAYGYDDGKCGHQNYGPMCSFVRFTPVKATTDSSGTTEAYIEMRSSSMATSRCKQFQEAVLFYGNGNHPFQLTLLADDVPIASETIPATQGNSSRSYTVPSTQKLRFEFESVSSPDIYGISLNSISGVGMSNIALRGNDGSAFFRVTSSSMQPAFRELEAGLFILQFGGNSVPYLSGSESARKHGESFRTHLQRFKTMHPGAAILVIGPSDMSTSVNGVMQTWPFLEQLNEGMKAAAFAEGCAFWDMFSVMGGRNSMLSWVSHNPPYAAPDYTHFTPAGARKMAELLAKAILDEYDAWEGEVKQ
jgi:lysophospholipase L1-like esterase